MADIYLRSTDGSDASDGLTWANAKATLAAALTAAGAGGRVFVSDNHAETQAAAMTLTSPGTAASPVQVLCVDDAGDPEPPTALATTATVSTTGVSAIAFAGFAYCYGIAFSAGTGASAVAINFTSSSAWFWIFDASKLTLGTSSSTSRINFGTSSTTEGGMILNNTPLGFGNVGQGIGISNLEMIWEATPSAVTGSIPTTLFLLSTRSASLKVVGCDLSALGSGKNLVNVASTNTNRYLFVDCKLGALVSITTGSVPGQGGPEVTLINCDSADTNYRYYKQNYKGTVTHETTIVRSGGLSDGTTAYSRKIVSTANSKLYSPLESQWFFVWNETTGSAVTVTIPVLTDNVTLTDAEAWVEVEYMGTSGFPQGVFISDRVAEVIATPANQPTDGTSSWVTTGLGTPVQQSLSVTFTPQEKGWFRARVMLARASTTLYVDKPVLS